MSSEILLRRRPFGKHLFLILAAVCFSLLSCLRLATAEKSTRKPLADTEYRYLWSPEQSADWIVHLNNRITELEKRVKELESVIEDLEKRIPSSSGDDR